MALKEALRLLLRLLGLGREIKGDERVSRKQVPESRSLASLPGTSQDDHGPRFCRAFQTALNFERTPQATPLT